MVYGAVNGVGAAIIQHRHVRIGVEDQTPLREVEAQAQDRPSSAGFASKQQAAALNRNRLDREVGERVELVLIARPKSQRRQGRNLCGATASRRFSRSTSGSPRIRG